MHASKEKTARVLIPKDRLANEDVLVSVNDRNYLIKRGAEVELPLEAAEILEEQQRALDRVEAYNAGHARG